MEFDENRLPASSHPWFKFHARDFMLSERVQMMDWEQRGIYTWLLAMCWLDQTIPAEPTKLARILKVPEDRFVALWPDIAACFEPCPDRPDRLIQPRVELERDEMIISAQAKSESGRKGGLESGKKRRAASATTMQNSREAKANAEADRSSASDPLKQNEAKLKQVASKAEANGKQNEATQTQTETQTNPTLGLDESSPNAPNNENDEVVEGEPLDVALKPTLIPVPDDLCREWPDDILELKSLAIRFLDVFGNARSPDAQRKHGPRYTDVLSAMKSRHGICVPDAWRAFAECLVAHDGKPLFGDQAKSAMNYLPSVKLREFAPKSAATTSITRGFNLATGLPMTRHGSKSVPGFVAGCPWAHYPPERVRRWLRDGVDDGGWPIQLVAA